MDIENITKPFQNVTVSNQRMNGTFYDNDIIPEYNDGAYSYEYSSDFFAKKYEYVGEWEIVIRGYVTFFIALATILTNILLISVFIFRSSRSYITIVLTSLAISDAIICFTRLPGAIYFNMAGNYKNLYITYQWCVANHVLYVIYQIFRMTSNWFTALLGVQRLLAIALPFKHAKVCNNRVTFVIIGVIGIVAVLLNLYEGLGIYIAELPIYTSWFFNESLPSSCIKETSLGLIEAFGDPQKSNLLFFIFSGLLCRVFPVVVLLVSTIALAFLLSRRKNVRTSASQRNYQIQRLTILILTIMLVFLISEVQDGIAYFIYAAELSQDKKYQIMSKEDDIMWNTISSLLSLISYAFNFWIFFLMSHQFRSALFDIFRSGFKKAHVYLNLDTEDKNYLKDASVDKNERSTIL
uniref:Sex peptide receptor-like n=1 Tax=Crassostrea virginica TaxID=6565 RepID=A0A8B8D5P4_CRAVI|nr:sex peptide receptor-like [Crassostrea virginica]